MTGREYSLCLEVDGRVIKTYIDGKESNSGIHRQPKLEELYFTAGSDDNNIYIKAVNVREKELTASLNIEGAKNINSKVETLTANPEDENSFDNPEKVSPVLSELIYETNEFEYTFPPQSITVFRIKK